MLTVIYMAQNKESADLVQETLKCEGLLVQIRSLSKNESYNNYFELLVPESEVNEAHRIIIENGF